MSFESLIAAAVVVRIRVILTSGRMKVEEEEAKEGEGEEVAWVETAFHHNKAREDTRIVSLEVCHTHTHAHTNTHTHTQMHTQNNTHTIENAVCVFFDFRATCQIEFVRFSLSI